MKGEQLIYQSQDMEEVFMKSFWEEVNKFHVNEFDENDEDGAQAKEVNCLTPSISLNTSVNDETNSNSLVSTELLGDMDALLSIAFEQYVTNTTNYQDTTTEIDEDPNNCYKLYER